VEPVGTYTVHHPTTKRLDHGDFAQKPQDGDRAGAANNAAAAATTNKPALT